MNNVLKKIVNDLLLHLGYKITKISKKVPNDVDEKFLNIYKKCKDYTMTSIERMYALYKATEYVVRHKIPGDIVECGVWKGGSSMICALTMVEMGDLERKIYMYDTYAGMSKPTGRDINIQEKSAKTKWETLKRIINQEIVDGNLVDI